MSDTQILSLSLCICARSHSLTHTHAYTHVGAQGDEWATDVRAPDGTARGTYNKAPVLETKKAAWGAGTNLASKLKELQPGPKPPLSGLCLCPLLGVGACVGVYQVSQKVCEDSF